MNRFSFRMHVILPFLLPFLTLSAQSPWTGTTAVPPLSGTTYSVSTAEQLAWVAEQSQSSDMAGLTVELTADIDLGGAAAVPPKWLPIGCADYPFAGEFNGNSHVIRNLYIMGTYTSAGLFAETAPTASIHHLALAQGLIMTDGTNDVGSLVGIHRGEIHHCFNMVQIIAHNGDRVGGLIGTNYGTIRYSYNTGIITDANDKVGGLVGLNKASSVIENCFNTAYCKGSDHAGSLFGQNEAGCTLTNVKYDQQLCRMHATGYGDTDVTVTTTDHAVPKTSQMVHLFALDSEWDTTAVESYPQLSCFMGLTASLLSTYAIRLDAGGLPTERADGVGAPKSGNQPRSSFTLGARPSVAATWVSDNPGVIRISSPTSATVSRPCTAQEVILTVSLGADVKKIYTQVKGYDSFNAGRLDGDIYVCYGEENVTLRRQNKGSEPTGGLDNEQTKAATAYTYKVFRYRLTLDEDSTEVRTLLDSVVMSYDTYQKWAMPTSEAGHYVFIRMVHDAQCHTEFLLSDGEFHLHVRELFHPGQLYAKADTIYGTPVDTVIRYELPATGGGGKYEYLWWRSRFIVDPVTRQRDTLEYNQTVRQGRDDVTTPTLPVTLTAPGEYVFTRLVRETTCTSGRVASVNTHTIVVYDSLRAGTIDSAYIELCEPLLSDTIRQLDSVAGGNGVYAYRWLCNDTVIAGADSIYLPLDSFPFTYGETYVFRREVIDSSGFTSEWLTSEGAYTVTIRDICDASCLVGDSGRITREVRVCMVDLPYHGVYTLADGTVQNYIFTDDGQSVTFTDTNEHGCALEVTLICRVTRVPVVEVEPIVSICQSDASFTIRYKVKEGKPDRYDLSFSENALREGFTNRLDRKMPTGNTIEITLPTTAVGQYSLYIQFYSSTAGSGDCKGFIDTIPFSLDLDGFVHRKWEDVVFVDNSDSNCQPDCDHDMSFTAWQWYKNDEPIGGATNQYYRETGGLNGVYYVVMTSSEGVTYRSCRYEWHYVTALEEVTADIPMDKVVETTIFTPSGNRVSEAAAPGIYLFRYRMLDNRIITRKQIVL